MVVNDPRKPGSVVVIQNYVKLFDRMVKIYFKTFIVLSVVYRRYIVVIYRLSAVNQDDGK